MTISARLKTLVSGLSCDTNSIELHVVRDSVSTSGESAVIDLHRDAMIGMMRKALSSKWLSSCQTTHSRLQSSHIGDMTMESFVSSRYDCKNHINTHIQQRSRSRVDRGTLLGVFDMRAEEGMPLVWMQWNKQRLPNAVFPCITNRDDLRHCVRREVSCGEGIVLCFETHMNASPSAIYRVWLQVSDVGSRNLLDVEEGIMRALHALGVTEVESVCG